MYSKALQRQDNIKKIFDRRIKARKFKIGDKVLKWDSRREEKGKHGKLTTYGLALTLFIQLLVTMHFSCRS